MTEPSCYDSRRNFPRCGGYCRNSRPPRSWFRRGWQRPTHSNKTPEAIGSGPFRFLANEYVVGSFAALTPFERYVPRNDPPGFTAGGHRLLVDRMEWKMIPDASTAANALVTGEVDWLEMPLPDESMQTSGVCSGYGNF